MQPISVLGRSFQIALVGLARLCKYDSSKDLKDRASDLEQCEDVLVGVLARLRILCAFGLRGELRPNLPV